MVYSLVFYSENFKEIKSKNVNSAYKIGNIDFVFEYTSKDIGNDFFSRNENILNQKRGAGLWLWKPYFVLQTLKKINFNDFLLYTDAGVLFVDKVDYLVNALNESKQDIMFFETPLISIQWTKEETFSLMNHNDDFFKSQNQISASFFLVKKTKFSMIFFEEFLTSCCDIRLIHNKIYNKNLVNPEIFLAHREDQSILSILAIRNHIIPFRDPSQFGHRPWEYITSDKVLFNFKKYTNSNYPKIFLHTRMDIGLIYIMKEKIKNLLCFFYFYRIFEINRRKRLRKSFYE